VSISPTTDGHEGTATSDEGAAASAASANPPNTGEPTAGLMAEQSAAKVAASNAYKDRVAMGRNGQTMLDNVGKPMRISVIKKRVARLFTPTARGDDKLSGPLANIRTEWQRGADAKAKCMMLFVEANGDKEHYYYGHIVLPSKHCQFLYTCSIHIAYLFFTESSASCVYSRLALEACRPVKGQLFFLFVS
jgi:hypothetical protein